jgi:hypothetical protein
MSSTGTPASDSTETNECRNSRGVHSFGSRGPGAAPFGSPAGRWLVRTHVQGLTDQVSQADRSSYLGVGGSTLDSHDMWIVRRELSRILDDNDPILLRHQRQQSGKQSRFGCPGAASVEYRLPGIRTPTGGHNARATLTPTGSQFGGPDTPDLRANLARSGRSTNRKLASASTTNMAIQAISPTTVRPSVWSIAIRARIFQR